MSDKEKEKVQNDQEFAIVGKSLPRLDARGKVTGTLKFIEDGAIQCGFCTPAMVLAGKALLDENPHPTRE